MRQVETTRPYLREGRVKVALELVPLMQGILKAALCGRQGLLTLPKRLQQLLPLVQHVHHQLLKVGVSIGAMGGPRGSPSLIVGITSHMAGVGRASSASGDREGCAGLAPPAGPNAWVSEQTVPGEWTGAQGLSHGISCSFFERRLVPGVPLWNGARGPGLTPQGWGWTPSVPRQADSSQAWP